MDAWTGSDRQPARCPCALSADGLAWPSHSIRSLDGTVKLVAMSDKLAPLYWCCVTPSCRRDAVGREILLSVECDSPDPLSPRRDHTELGSGQRISPIGRQGALDHQDDLDAWQRQLVNFAGRRKPTTKGILARDDWADPAHAWRRPDDSRRSRALQFHPGPYRGSEHVP